MTNIADPKKYFSLIQRILNSSAIDKPKSNFDIFELKRRKNGELLGWEIRNKIISFYDENFLKASEKAKSNKLLGEYSIDQHSYHFNPKKDCGLECFRIDKNKSQGLHANDERNGQNIHHLPDDLKLDIKCFNLYLAIHLCLFYICKGEYPLDNDKSDEYNSELNNYRRECNG